MNLDPSVAVRRRHLPTLRVGRYDFRQWIFDEAAGVSRRARERISGVEAP
jgi:hypothetical protein